MPAVVNVKVNTELGVILPLAIVVPSSVLTVWLTPSLFFHLTGTPTCTVSIAGLYLKPDRLMESVANPVGGGGGGTVGEYGLLLLQERIAIEIIQMNKVASKMKFFFMFFILLDIKTG